MEEANFMKEEFSIFEYVQILFEMLLFLKFYNVHAVD